MKLTINNETVNDSRTIANEFNNFFVSIGPALADTITCSVDPMSCVDNIMNSMVISYEARHHKMVQMSRFLNIEIHTYSYSRI